MKRCTPWPASMNYIIISNNNSISNNSNSSRWGVGPMVEGHTLPPLTWIERLTTTQPSAAHQLLIGARHHSMKRGSFSCSSSSRQVEAEEVEVGVGVVCCRVKQVGPQV
jgi:hypothetical protein